jgi:hypothetical protein
MNSPNKKPFSKQLLDNYLRDDQIVKSLMFKNLMFKQKKGQS